MHVASRRRRGRGPRVWPALLVATLVLGASWGQAQEGSEILELNESRLVDLRRQVQRLTRNLHKTQVAHVAAVNSRQALQRQLGDAVALVSSLSATLKASSAPAEKAEFEGRLEAAQSTQKAVEKAFEEAEEGGEKLEKRLRALEHKLKSSREGLERQDTWMRERFRPELPGDELRAFLRPLKRAELEVEAVAWINLVQQKVSATSANELWLAANKTGRSRADIDERMESLALLQDDRAKLVDRAKQVLEELRIKGGDEKLLGEHQAYLSAVSGIQIDTSDSRATAVAIWNWLRSEEGGLRWGKNLIAFLLTLAATWLASRFLGWSAARASRLGAHSELLQETVGGLVRKGVLLLGFVIALSALEVNTTPLMAALGGAALVIGLALQGTLANFAAGLLIVGYRPYDRGSLIEAAGVLGTVREMNMLSTTLVTPDNKCIVIPNGAVWNGTITNLTGLPTRRVDLVVGVGYESDLEQVQAALAQLVQDHPLVLENPEPVIAVHELADSSVNFVVRPWCKTGDYWDVYWDLTRNVKLRFDELGIEIPFPQTQVHLPSPSPPVAQVEAVAKADVVEAAEPASPDEPS